MLNQQTLPWESASKAAPADWQAKSQGTALTASSETHQGSMQSPEEEFARRFYGAARVGATPTPPADTSQLGRGKEHAEDFARRFYGMDDESDVPALDDPDDDDMTAIRKDWAPYPAEVNKAIPVSYFAQYVGKKVEIEGKSVEITRDMAVKTVSVMRALAGDLNLNRYEAADLMEAIRNAKPQGDEAAAIPRREETIDALNREHGDKSNKAFKAARAYVSKNPILAGILDRSGLGDDPKVVTLLARKALALHDAGKLKVK
jgi:hypothetical protein